MSKLKVFDSTGASVGELDLADALLVTDKGEQAVQDVVLAHTAAMRAGTASTKTKSAVAGTGAKPWQQKGSGRARAGYKQSPVWRGGGVAFGPHPRDYAVKVNRKVNQLAFRRAFTDRVVDGGLKVVDGLAVSEGRTREFAAVMKALDVKGPTLFVVDRVDPKLAQSCRNIPRVALVPAGELQVYDLVRYPVVVVTRDGMAVLEKRLGGGKGAA